MTYDELLKNICDWIDNYDINEGCSKQELVDFTHDLQGKIEELGFSYTIAEGEQALTYCGYADGTAVFKQIDEIVKGTDYAYISNTEAGKLIMADDSIW